MLTPVCPANSSVTSTGTCTCNTSYNFDPTGTSCVLIPGCISPRLVIGSACVLPTGITDPFKVPGSPNTCAFTNPCDAGSGNKYQREVDYAGLGVFPLHAERAYNSGGTTPSAAWGSQWRGFYDRSISLISTGTISTATVKRADGKSYNYNLVNGAWAGDADVVGTLVQTGVDASGNPTGGTYTNERDEVETYNASGQMVSITNRAGQSQTLTYSCTVVSATCPVATPATVAPAAGLLLTVTDPDGRSLNFSYDTSSRVVRMTDPAGGAYTYVYDANNNLTTVTYPDGKVRGYLYGETANVSGIPNAGVSYTHSLTGIVDENGNRYASWTYDAAGLAASSEHGAFGSGIDHVGLAYGTPDANGGSTTTVTDVMGVARSYTFGTLLGVVKNTGITGQPCNGCSAALTYDANGNVANRTDFNGNTTCYAYDPTRNLETTRIEGLPAGVACPANLATATLGGVEHMITTRWDATYRLPAIVAEPLRITTYTYDAKGNPLTRSVQPTNDATGGAGLTAAATGTPRIWTYTYNTAGQVLTLDGPRTDIADITSYAYDAQNNLVTVTDPFSRVTTLGGYDANGRPGTLTDPNGLITGLTFDARGRLTSRSAGGETTAYTYDGAGSLTGVALPTGAAYTYSYDAAHRLTGIADAQGNKLAYTLDNAGNRTKEQLYDSAGNLVQTHSRVFNNLSRLVQDIGAVNQTTVYTYDNEGNVRTVTDPLNRLSANAYDALNRLSRVTNPDSGVVQYAYDGENQLTGVTDPRNLVTRYTRDGLGNLNQQTSPDTGVTANTFDAAGNLLSRTDAKGQVASYTYDALNRLAGISYSGGTSPPQMVSYQYDQGTNGIGHLTGIIDSTGITNYVYDQHGRLTGETDWVYGAVYTTAYGYDARGRLASITYPSGRTVNYSFDTLGRINGVATGYNGTTQVLASSIVYRPFGGVQSFNYGDGVTAPVQSYTRQYDQDGRIASYTLNSKPMSIGYDAASQISFISDPQSLATTASYSYDPMSRLTGFTQGATGQSLGYDLDGNRISQTIGTTPTAYGHGTTSNRLTSIQTGAGTPQAVTQDAVGSTTSDATRQYAYDVRGRLIQTTTAQGVISYEVNALGLRVRKQVPYANTDTEYHYDIRGHLIGESPTGATQFSREYIYLGDQPVAVMQ